MAVNSHNSRLLSRFPFACRPGPDWEASILETLTLASAEANLEGVALLLAQPQGFRVQQLLIAPRLGLSDYALWTDVSNRSEICQVELSFQPAPALDYLQRTGLLGPMSLESPPDPTRGRVVSIWVAVGQRGAWRQLQAPNEGHPPENPLDRLIQDFQKLTLKDSTFARP